jgi:hypothetical protein
MNPKKTLSFNEVTKDVGGGKWVVLSEDGQSVFCEGYTCDEVMNEAKEKGQTNPVAYKIMRIKKACSRFGFVN